MKRSEMERSYVIVNFLGIGQRRGLYFLMKTVTEGNKDGREGGDDVKKKSDLSVSENRILA